MKIQSPNNPVNFKAIPRAQYTLKNAKKAVVFELEKYDVNFLKAWRENLPQFIKNNGISGDTKIEIIEKALNACVNALSNPKSIGKKASLYLAVVDRKICGIIIGGMAKKSKNPSKIVYSSRKNCGKLETEGDFFATWHDAEYKGIGKALLAELFKGSLQSGFKNLYARAETPQNSGAIFFYLKYGFKLLSGKIQHKFKRNCDSSYLGGDYFSSNDLMLPVKINKKGMLNAIKKISIDMSKKDVPSSRRCDFFKITSHFE